MAYQTATIYPSEDHQHGKLLESSWGAARDATTSDTNNSTSIVPVASWRTSGRGGTTFTNYRYFANFNISSALPYGSAIMSAKMKIRFDNSDGEMRLIRHDQTSSLASTGTYDACIYGSGGTNSEGDMITFSDEFVDNPAFPPVYTTVTLNASARKLIQGVAGTEGSTFGLFGITLVTKLDYDHTSPSDTTSYDHDIHTDAYTGTSRDPHLLIEYEGPPTLALGADF
jgi:hypothetical protein